MALNTFGASPDDVTTDSDGTTVGGIQLTVWTTKSRSVQVNSLYAVDGVTPLPGYVTSSTAAPPARGRYEFKASDSYSLLWLWDGNPANEAWPIAAQEALADVGPAILKADQASVDAAAAQASAASADSKATTADNRSTDALTEAQAARDDVAGALYGLGRGATVAGLSSQVWAAHRGGLGVAPENTFEAFDAALARGVEVLEMDAYLLADGTLAVMHDSTVDRTTNLSGLAGDLSAQAVVNAKVDAGSWFCNTWRSDLRVPLLRDVFERYGGRVVLLVEAKNTGGGAAITSLVQRYGLTDSVIVAAFMSANLTAPKAAGITTQYLTSVDPATVDWNLYADLFDRVGIIKSDDPAWIADAHAVGLKADVWTLSRRWEAQPFIDAGVDMLICNDPWYVGQLLPVSTKGLFNGTFPSGLLGDAPDPHTIDARGGFYGSGLTKWGYANQPTSGTRPDTSAFALMGQCCPVANASGTWSLTFSVQMDVAGGWASAMVCAPDDKLFDDFDSGESMIGVNGYHVLFRANGQISIFKVTDGNATSLGNSSVSVPVSAGATIQCKVTVTPTTVKAERLDAPTVTFTASDSAYRGAYFHLGSFEVEGKFSALTVA